MSLSLSHRLSLIGPIGVYAYVIGFAFPSKCNLPFIILIVAGIISAVFRPRNLSFKSPRLPLFLLMLFLVTMGLSIVASNDVGRSLRLSSSFLPALLIFLLITEGFINAKDIRHLYLCCSIAGLGIAIASLGVAWENNFDFSSHQKAHALVSWSPILISRNDLAILSLLAPLSITLAYQKLRSVVGIITIISFFLSACTVVVFQSRGATLTMLTAIICTLSALKPQKSIIVGAIILLVFLVVDAAMGFPLIQRFSDLSNNRYRHWVDALVLFSNSPLLGHGPHTFGLFNKIPWPHNLYIEVLFGHGIIGFAAFGASLSYMVSVTWKTRHSESDELRIYGAGTFGAIAGFLISGVVELSFIRQWVVVVFFILFGTSIKLSSLQTKGDFYERS